MIEITISNGDIMIIDDEDADLAQYRWSARPRRNRCYAQRGVKIDGKTVYLSLHRVILERKLGRSLERGEYCDHEHGNTWDNRRSELRLSSHQQNTMNRGATRKNTTGFKGVSFDKKKGDFKASIGVNGKKFNLGNFATPEEAYAVYCEAAIKYHGKFARLK